jgi:hypothetical protein
MTTSGRTTPARPTRRTGRRRAAPALGLVLIALGLLAPAAARPAPAAAPALVLADVQVRELTADRQYLVHVRSTGAQAFDVLPAAAGVVRVRLHGAQLGAIADLVPADFGSITLREEPAAVLLRVELADPAYTVRVTQGGNPSVVELRIAR